MKKTLILLTNRSVLLRQQISLFLLTREGFRTFGPSSLLLSTRSSQRGGGGFNGTHGTIPRSATGEGESGQCVVQVDGPGSKESVISGTRCREKE